MNEKMVTLDEVGAAFERLVAHVLASGCGGEYARTIHMAGVDVLAILRGEWDEGRDTRYEIRDTSEEEEAAGEGPDVARCPRCNQSLRDVGKSKFACPGCYEAFGDEAIEAALPFWGG